MSGPAAEAADLAGARGPPAPAPQSGAAPEALTVSISVRTVDPNSTVDNPQYTAPVDSQVELSEWDFASLQALYTALSLSHLRSTLQGQFFRVAATQKFPYEFLATSAQLQACWGEMCASRSCRALTLVKYTKYQCDSLKLTVGVEEAHILDYILRFRRPYMRHAPPPSAQDREHALPDREDLGTIGIADVVRANSIAPGLEQAGEAQALERLRERVARLSGDQLGRLEDRDRQVLGCGAALFQYTAGLPETLSDAILDFRRVSGERYFKPYAYRTYEKAAALYKAGCLPLLKMFRALVMNNNLVTLVGGVADREPYPIPMVQISVPADLVGEVQSFVGRRMLRKQVRFEREARMSQQAVRAGQPGQAGRDAPASRASQASHAGRASQVDLPRPASQTPHARDAVGLTVPGPPRPAQPIFPERPLRASPKEARGTGPEADAWGAAPGGLPPGPEGAPREVRGSESAVLDQRGSHALPPPSRERGSAAPEWAQLALGPGGLGSAETSRGAGNAVVASEGAKNAPGPPRRQSMTHSILSDLIAEDPVRQYASWAANAASAAAGMPSVAGVSGASGVPDLPAAASGVPGAIPEAIPGISGAPGVPQGVAGPLHAAAAPFDRSMLWDFTTAPQPPGVRVPALPQAPGMDAKELLDGLNLTMDSAEVLAQLNQLSQLSFFDVPGQYPLPSTEYAHPQIQQPMQQPLMPPTIVGAFQPPAERDRGTLVQGPPIFRGMAPEEPQR